MGFEATRVTDDAGSPRPRGAGYAEFAWDITQAPGDVGGDITTPFTDTDDIEVVAWTPTNGPSSVPSITAATVTNNFVVVTVELEDGSDGRLRLVGRGM
jgi:hypothetical protein